MVDFFHSENLSKPYRHYQKNTMESNKSRQMLEMVRIRLPEGAPTNTALREQSVHSCAQKTKVNYTGEETTITRERITITREETAIICEETAITREEKNYH